MAYTKTEKGKSQTEHKSISKSEGTLDHIAITEMYFRFSHSHREKLPDSTLIQGVLSSVFFK
jgi:hypothetical protein